MPVTRLSARRRAWLLGPLLACLVLSTQARAAGAGRLHVLVFDGASGVPLEGIEVRLGGRRVATTGSAGACYIELPPGRHRLRVGGGPGGYPFARTDPIRVVEGAVTEVLFHLDRQRPGIRTDLEAAGARTVSRRAGAGARLSRVRGTIVHLQTREPVAGARVFVRGHDLEARTDARGRFELRLPVGTHELSAVHPDFSTMTRPGVRVREGAVTEVTLEATPLGVQLETFTVSAPRITGGTVAMLEERRTSGTVMDVIGAEQMARAGDTDAAGALRRVTGVSIVDGRFVYVRGMGERYSATLLNGLNLPSPEPERRVVPLDMFPTGMIESVVIQKTYSPDRPGEFGGGAVQIRTRGYPDELHVLVELGAGYVQGTTFDTTRVAADASATDFLGFGASHRALPGRVQRATARGPLELGNSYTGGFTAEELEAIGRAMRNGAIWALEERLLAPDLKLSATVGNSHALGRHSKLGFMVSAIYANRWDREAEIRRDRYRRDRTGLVWFDGRTFQRVKNEITLAGVGAVGLDIGEAHRIRLNALVDRISDSVLQTFTGFDANTDSRVRDRAIEWKERMMLAAQLTGQHQLARLRELEIDWRYAYSHAGRDAPDIRHVLYQRDSADEPWRASQFPFGNGREFGTVRDQAHDWQLDLGLPFAQWTGEQGLVKVGGAVLVKRREVDLRRFSYDRVGDLEPGIRVLPPEAFFVADHISMDQLRLGESTLNTDNRTGAQDVLAGYAMVDLPLGLGFRVSGGLRVERSRQVSASFELFAPEKTPVESVLETVDVLPAATLSYELRKGMLLRLGYGRTLNRPDFLEMSPVCVEPYVGGEATCGARADGIELRRAVLDNLDLRWEWYPGAGESISLALFYKNIDDPIETVMRASSDRGATFRNADRATIVGLELDLRQRFDFVADALEDLYLGGNATWVHSTVSLPPGGQETSRERSLEGQSPYVFNVQLGYDNVDSGTSVTLLYNVFGPRLRAVGVLEQPDIFELPVHQLDFVARQALGRGFKLGLKARNLLDPLVSWRQGDKITEQYRRGREISLSLSWEL